MAKTARTLAAFLLLVVPFLLKAQVTTSSITGHITDDKNEPLTGATITATHQPSGTTYVTVSRQSGLFVFPSVRVGGPYQLKVEYVGFKPQTVDNFTVILGEPYDVNVTMSASSQELKEVVVSASGPRRGAVTKTGASTNISSRQINTLPTISRSLSDFTRITPQASGNNFAGMDGRYNNVQVDGANLNNNFGLNTDFLPGNNAQPISLDAIEEVSVNVAPYDVRQSNFTGAGINAVTRSGDNTFRGSVYGFYRDQSFNGKHVGSFTLPAPPQQSNKLYGFRLGGPIIKNKLFFFINAEKEENQFPSITFRPSQPGVSGDNVSSTSADSLKKFSDFLRSQYQYDAGAYDNFPPFSSNNHKLLAKLDWNIDSRNKLTLKYSEMVSTGVTQPLNGSSIPNGGISRGSNPMPSLANGISRDPNNRFSKNSMGFFNSNYGFNDKVRSASLELNTTFTPLLSNQFIGTFTKIRDTRIAPGKLFPSVDIFNNNGQNYMFAGYDPFTNNNDVINDVYTATDNITWHAGKHIVTGGVSFEYQKVGNMFMPGSESYYIFNTLNDFITNQAPIYYAYTYSLVPGQQAVYSANMKIGQAGVYLQDEFNTSPSFRLTYGLRIDRPIFFEQPLKNPIYDTVMLYDKSGQLTTFSTGKFPKERLYFSPRVGFRWDVNGDKSFIFRGGTGLFTGRIPYVWLTNIPTNSSMYQNSVKVDRPADLQNYTFNPNPDAYVNKFPKTAATTLNGAQPVFTNPDFRFPQSWRTDLAFDKSLGSGYTATVEILYNKTVNSVYMYNANQTQPAGRLAGPDQRARFTNNNRLHSYLSNAIVLDNSDQGSSFSLTGQISKSFSKGLYGSLAYTYTLARDITTNPGSQATSVWNGNPTSGTQNDQEISYTSYAMPHRIVGNISYRFEYLQHFATTLSLFYEGTAQGTFSYVYNGDVNGDGNNATDLMYIPRSPSEIIFAPIAASSGSPAFTPQQQSDAFFRYIDQDKYLSRHKGQIAERNAARLPFYHRLDMKILQDFFIRAGKTRHTLQFSADFLNFANLISQNWGIRNTVVVNNPLVFKGYDANGQPAFNMAVVNKQLVTNTFNNLQSTASTWGVQLGLRYIF